MPALCWDASTIFASKRFPIPKSSIRATRSCMHPMPELQEAPFAYPTAAVYGCTHAFGGLAVRTP